MTALWQAASADSIQLAVREVFSAREYDWRFRARTSMWSKVWSLFLRLLAWLDRLHDTHPVGYWALIGLLCLMLAVILGHFVYVLWRSLRPAAPTRAAAAVGPPPRDARWHLAEARRLAAAGRLTDALGHRYLAMVMELDRRGALKFHPSKTPAEYLREAQLDADGQSGFASLVWALYRHLFGGVPVAVDDWTEFDRAAESLSVHVAPA
ncbi:MAG: DUF4129 domain-containing protein [Acidobacteriota bacterium]